MSAAFLWGWRDLRAHWTRPVSAPLPLWPLWLALGIAAFGLLTDVSVYFDVAEARDAAHLDPAILRFFEFITRFGESGWLFAASILILAGALVARQRASSARQKAALGLLASRAFYFFAVQAVSGILSQVVKHLVGRARPKLLDTLGPHHFDFFSVKAVLASFPSGHTTTMFAAAAALSFFTPRYWPALFGFALLVAASRLGLGSHYPSDVLGGAALGLASAFAVARIFARRKIAFTSEGEELMPKPRGSGMIGEALGKRA